MAYLAGLTYQKWLADTAVGGFSMRGENLQKLDKAIKEYCENRNLSDKCLASTENLSKALEDWVRHKMMQASKGPWDISMSGDERKNRIWMADRRNARGAISSLFNSLYPGSSRPITKEEHEALEYLKECTEKLAAKLFAGKKMNFRLLAAKAKPKIDYAGPTGRIGAVSDFIKANTPRAAVAVSLAKTGKKTGKSVYEFIGDMVSGAIAKQGIPSDKTLEILEAIGSDVLTDAVKTLTPLLGGILLTTEGALQIANGVSRLREAERLKQANWFKGETASAAVASVTEMLVDAGEENVVKGGSLLAVGVASIVAEAIPGGQGFAAGAKVGVTIGKLIWLVAGYCEDWNHMKKVNEFLATVQDPDTSPADNTVICTGKELFELSPLLGAYWIMIAPTSSVIGIGAEDVASATFMLDIERIAKTQLKDLRNAAAKLIASSRIVIPELSAHRLTNERSTLSGCAHRITHSCHLWTLFKRAEKRLPHASWKDRIVGLGPGDIPEAPSDPIVMTINPMMIRR